jgi:hypothetical protein
MGAIKESFKIILSGDKEKSRLASRQIRKILYSSKGDKYLYIEILLMVLLGNIIKYKKLGVRKILLWLFQ